jgi:predicted GTPase
MATTRRRSRKQHCLLCRWTIACRGQTRRILIATARKARQTWHRIRSGRPTIIADAPRREAWQLRRLTRRTARCYAKALGVSLPNGLAIIVQRVVFDGRQVNGLLTAFETGASRRYVIQLALSANGREVSVGELVAALRHQLSAVFADTIGKPVLSVALDLERGLPAPSGGSIVELRPQPSVAANGHGQEADPFALSRVTDYQEGEAS